MKRTALLTLLAALAMAPATGCVSQRQADNYQRLYRQAQEQLIDLQAQLEAKDAELAALRNAGPDRASQERLAALQAERDRLQKALADAEARLREAGSTPVALPTELDDALRELAEQYPDLMEYDPALGMVKFRSDLTFALGSAEVNPQAQASLSRLAQILQSPIAQGYEVRIVGHTDAAPIRSEATRARHPNNWYLSAHRAISVRDVMERSGIQPTRLGVGGYGEYRPIVPNGPRGQAEQNRRVEIFIVQMPGGGPSAGDVTPAPRGAAPAPAAADFAPEGETAPAPAPARSAQPEAPEMFK